MRFSNLFGGKVEAEKLYEKLLEDEEQKEAAASSNEGYGFSWGYSSLYRPEFTFPSPGKWWWYDSSYGFFAKFFFTWINRIIHEGFSNPLEKDDMLSLPKELSSREQSSKFQKKWNICDTQPHSRLVCVMYDQIKVHLWISGGFRLVCEVCGLISPLILEQLVLHVDGHSSLVPNTKFGGLVLALLLFLVALTQSVCLQQFIHGVFMIGAKLNATAILLVFEKALKLPEWVVSQRTNRGKLASLQSKDAEKLRQFVVFFHNLWAAPFTAMGAILILLSLLGPASLVGVVIIPLLIPLETWVAKRSKGLKKDSSKHADQRLGALGEMVDGIKSLKLCALEDRYKDKVSATRDKELFKIISALRLDALNQALLRAGPILVAMLTFLIYTWTGHELTPAKAFTALSLFNALTHPFITMPKAVSLFTDAKVAVERLSGFLLQEEVENGPTHVMDATLPAQLSVKGVSFGHELEGGPTLHEVFFEAGPGLTIIVGRIGSGKSCLLAGILNELKLADKEKVVQRSRTSTVAYCPSDPWILNDTVRGNICAGADDWQVDEAYYQVAKQACALDIDMEAWPHGEDTVIGERGMTISGGQKARLALARAMYAKAQVVLLDDPLASSDTSTGRHVFEHCILAMAHKHKAVVIMATHQRQYLQRADRLIVLDEGRIRAHGTYKEIVDKGFDFTGMLHEETTDKPAESEKTGQNKKPGEKDGEVSHPLAKTNSNPAMKRTQLKIAEDRQRGKVDWSIYTDYLKACGFNLSLACGVFSLSVHIINVSKEVVLSFWSEQSGSTHIFLPIYVIIGWSVVLLNFLRFLFVFALGNQASRTLHAELLDAVIGAPLAFFQTTPSGRITARFSGDMDKIDTTIPSTLSSFVDNVLTMGSAVAVIIYSSPFFFLALIPIFYAYYWTQSFYRASSKELKRLDSSTKSPIFSHFQQCIDGLSSIRAYNIQSKMIEENQFLVDEQLKARLCWDATNRWLGIRLDVLGACIVFSAAFLVVTFGGNSAGKVGLAITYAITVTKTLSFGVRAATNMQNHFNSSERIHEYLALQQERETSIPPFSTVSPSWPNQNSLRFEKVTARYRSDLDVVLKEVSFHVNPCETIGVCGRTGSGKSTLVAALVRLMEIEAGRILVDGVDIRGIPLKTLRSKVTVIPQDAHIFSGTVREVLDPFGNYTDSFIWETLEKLALKDLISNTGHGLDSLIAERGSNFSAGQKQLLTIARSIINGSTIFIFDEASAHMDVDTARVLQQVVSAQLSDCTVMIVAHRLTDLVGCDRVVVMESAEVVEIGSPKDLLQDSTSYFSSLALELGDALQSELRDSIANHSIINDNHTLMEC